MFKKIVLMIAILAISMTSAWAMAPIRISGTAMGIEGHHDVLVNINGTNYGMVPQVQFVNGAYSFRLADQIASYEYNPLNIITLSTNDGMIFLSRRLDMVIDSQSMFGDAIEPDDLDMTQEYNFKSDVRIGTGGNSILMRPITVSGQPTITAGYLFATTGLGIDTDNDGLVSSGDAFGVDVSGNLNANDIVAAGNITGKEMTATKLTAPTVLTTNLTATGIITGTIATTTLTTGSLVASFDNDATPALTVTQAGVADALLINGKTTANGNIAVDGAVTTKGFMLNGIVLADDSDGDNIITVDVTASTSIIRITTGADGIDDQLNFTGGTPGQIIIVFVDSASTDALRWDPTTILSGATMMLTIDPDRWEIINF